MSCCNFISTGGSMIMRDLNTGSMGSNTVVRCILSIKLLHEMQHEMRLTITLLLLCYYRVIPVKQHLIPFGKPSSISLVMMRKYSLALVTRTMTCCHQIILITIITVDHSQLYHAVKLFNGFSSSNLFWYHVISLRLFVVQIKLMATN